jgi:hypothetical protein
VAGGPQQPWLHPSRAADRSASRSTSSLSAGVGRQDVQDDPAAIGQREQAAERLPVFHKQHPRGSPSRASSTVATLLAQRPPPAWATGPRILIGRSRRVASRDQVVERPCRSTARTAATEGCPSLGVVDKTGAMPGFWTRLDLVARGGAQVHLASQENQAENQPVCSHFSKWRGPESNRRHHDFQGGSTWPLWATKSLHTALSPLGRYHVDSCGYPRIPLGLGREGPFHVPLNGVWKLRTDRPGSCPCPASSLGAARVSSGRRRWPARRPRFPSGPRSRPSSPRT